MLIFGHSDAMVVVLGPYRYRVYDPFSACSAAPYPGDSLVSSGRYYALFLKNKIEFLKTIVQAETEHSA